MFKGRIADNYQQEMYVHDKVSRLTNVMEHSPVESFYYQETLNDDGTTSVSVVDDVYMLFNQQRLDRMTSASLNQWLEQSSKTDTQLASLRSRMTDEQLGSFIKSRYIQSRSELLAWSGYLESQFPDIVPPVSEGGDEPPADTSSDTQTE